MKSFLEMVPLLNKNEVKKIAVVAAHDRNSLLAFKIAEQYRIAEPILIGKENEIRKLAQEVEYDLEGVAVINQPDDEEACYKGIELLRLGRAHILMKGLVDSKIVLQAILDRDKGLRGDSLISHVAVMFIEKYHKMMIVTDSSINIAPDLERKKKILENAVSFAKKLGVSNPKCAVVCAKEKVDEAMIHTIDAEKLREMNASGEIKDCIVDGPFGFDNAVSKKAAMIKKVNSTVAGDADIILVPTIEAGNILYKSLTFLSNSESAGIILGAKSKIIFTSRADNEINKFNSIILGAFYCDCEVRDDYFGS